MVCLQLDALEVIGSFNSIPFAVEELRRPDLRWKILQPLHARSERDASDFLCNSCHNCSR